MQSKSIKNDSQKLFPSATSQKSTMPNCRKESGLSQEDSLARTYPLQVRERGSGEVGRVFGLRCGELLGSYNPDGLLPKISRQLPGMDWGLFLTVLPK